MKYCNKKVVLLVMIFVAAVFVYLGGKIVKAEVKNKATNWNSPSLSFFYDEQSKDNLIKSLPEWNIQPMIWPTKEEIESHLGVATENQKEECIKWIKKYLKDEWVPWEISSYILPLRNWGKPDTHWKEKGKADVFLCRYSICNYLIQIMDGNWAIIITVKEVSNIPPVKKDAHKNFVSKKFELFWKGEPSRMRLAQQQPANVTRGGINFGERWATFVSDGKFTQFKMKKISGHRLFPDPYKPRFSAAQK